MQLPPSYTLELYAGDDRDFIVRWRDEAGDPINLTGYSALMQIKTDPCGAADLEVVGVIALPLTGEIVFPISSAESQALVIDCSTTCYKYDVQLTEPSGDIKTILRGAAKAYGDVTA